MTNHDGSYKHIFSHPEVVIDLMRGFVHEDWVKELDYSSLEKVNGSYITDDLRDRADDIIWRVKRHNDWLYLYLLIEFQSLNATRTWPCASWCTPVCFTKT